MRTFADISVSLDGYLAGPAPSLEEPLGRGGEGPWNDDSNSTGWWGDEPPFHAPVFVVTHHPRPSLELTGTTFTFVTDGVASALAQAREAAGERDVQVSGGADVIQQAIELGRVDELQLHTAPVVLGAGTALLDGVAPAALEIVETIATPQATHVHYRITKTHS